ncbi:MAG: flagellar hook-associated protein FlgK [Pirellulales bacterium]|nr:flagellar hook-associated protein FlgK [Pirellulales bacterium]
MSLFSSIQLANNALKAQQIGLQVVGQNIANANTPGYIREEVKLAPAATQQYGGLLLGLGVQVVSVKQKIDLFLEQRLRNSTSDRARGEVKEQSYQQLEAMVNALGDNNLSTSLNNFFSSIAQVLNQPESVAARNLAALKGQTLAQDISSLSTRARQNRSDMNDRVTKMSDDINRLVEEVRSLNQRITQAEAGDSSKSDAVGLRDQRYKALTSLSELIDIRVDEQNSGAVNVYNGGSYLVFEALSRKVEVAQSTDRGLTISNLQFADSKAPIDASGGELSGLIESRDQIIGGFLDQLDDFAHTLAFEFNRVYSSGQGLKGFSELTSNNHVANTDAPLDAAGLSFTPVNGSFQVKVYNRQTKITQTTDIQVKLNGLDDDTSLTDLVAQINGINGLSASLTADKRLKIVSNASNQEFAFADDTSGALAALGVNVYFTGNSAISLGVDQGVLDDPARFAASTKGIGSDTDNATKLAAFLDRPLESKNNSTLADLYDKLAGDLTQASSVAKADADGFRVFEQTLVGHKNAVSGVSLDDEAVNMLAYQRVFQTSAKYIATLNELLGILVNL